ncbi:MAG TPA: hypothetical protein VGL72_09725, partial [Bryobacteraceae bacterium]
MSLQVQGAKTIAAVTGRNFFHVPSHVPSHPQTAAKARGFFVYSLGFTAETDWLLEESGFELVWGFSCQVVVLGFAESSLFGAGKPFFVPSPAIRFAERAEGVKG